MATNLTGNKVKDTYSQLLHIDGGVEAAEKVVRSGTGTASAMSLGTGSASVDNIKFDGNTISTTNTNGNLLLSPDGTGEVRTDNIAFNGNTISTTDTNGDLTLAPNGTGKVNIANINLTGGTVTSGVSFAGASFTGITSITSTTLNGGNLRLTANTFSSTNTNGNITVSPDGTGTTVFTKPFGYGGSGTGGTVTQATSRTTGVTLDKITGEIVLFAGTIAGHEADEFTLTNSFIAANDVVVCSIKSGCLAATRKYYQVNVVAATAGSCVISIGNIDNATIPSSGTDSPVIQFVVIKGAIA